MRDDVWHRIIIFVLRVSAFPRVLVLGGATRRSSGPVTPPRRAGAPAGDLLLVFLLSVSERFSQVLFAYFLWSC